MISRSVIDTENVSDFDVFNALSEKLYLLAGNPIRDRFLDLICKASFSEINPAMLCDLEYRKNVWQKIFSDSSIMLPQTVMFIEENAHRSKKKDGFCLNYLIDSSFEDIYDLLDNVIVKIEHERAEECFFDATDIEYIRPDDFHAQKEYVRLKNGENDSSTVALWLLCRVLMKARLNLRLKVESAKKAEDIISLISRLGLSPTIIISFDISKMTDYNGLYQFLINNYKKNISLDVSCSRENKNEFLNFLNVVPLVFVENINSKLEIIQEIFDTILSKEESALAISYLYTVK